MFALVFCKIIANPISEYRHCLAVSYYRLFITTNNILKCYSFQNWSEIEAFGCGIHRAYPHIVILKI